MSFGFSVGDLIATTQLAWKAFQATKDAPQIMNDIATELQSLKNAVQTIEGLEPRLGQQNDIIPLLKQSTKTVMELQSFIAKSNMVIDRHSSWSRLFKTRWDREEKTGIDMEVERMKQKLACQNASCEIVLHARDVDEAVNLEKRRYGDLQCEFSSYLGCDARFHPAQLDLWVQHSIAHFNPLPPPPTSCCFFCDEKEDLQGVGQDTFSSWRERMIHIGGHMQNLDEIRPDPFVIEYMKMNNLISGKDYRTAMEKMGHDVPAISSGGKNEWKRHVDDFGVQGYKNVKYSQWDRGWNTEPKWISRSQGTLIRLHLSSAILVAVTFEWLNTAMDLVSRSKFMGKIINMISSLGEGSLQALNGIPDGVIFAIFVIVTAIFTATTFVLLARITSRNLPAKMLGCAVAFSCLAFWSFMGVTPEELCLVFLPQCISSGMICSCMFDHGETSQQQLVIVDEEKKGYY